MSRFAPRTLHWGYILLWVAMTLSSLHLPSWWDAIPTIFAWMCAFFALVYTEKMCYQYGTENGYRGQHGVANYDPQTGHIWGVSAASSVVQAQNNLSLRQDEALRNTGGREWFALAKRDRKGKWKIIE
jgi:hypothetical protein